MNRRVGLLLGAGLVCLQTGCVLHNAYLSGDLRVRVVDAGTRQPVAGARVTIRSEESSKAVGEALSDGAGLVEIPALRGNMRVAPLGDTLPPSVALTVEAAGYKAFATEIAPGGPPGSRELDYWVNNGSAHAPAEIAIARP